MINVRDRLLAETLARAIDGRRGDRDVADRVWTVRQRLPVSGAWAYCRIGNVVVVVVDECYSDKEVKRLVKRARRRLSNRRGDG